MFGYGSLVWRPDFPFAERHLARIQGFVRRFWQGSVDHRGVPGAPGRVVTLVPSPDATCGGVVYRVDPSSVSKVMARLDQREKGGYVRHTVRAQCPGGRGIDGVEVYVATAENRNYLGPASEEAIAEQVAGARGPSGDNAEYVLRLGEALRQMGEADPHVFAIERLVRARLALGATGE